MCDLKNVSILFISLCHTDGFGGGWGPPGLLKSWNAATGSDVPMCSFAAYFLSYGAGVSYVFSIN